MNGIEDLIKRYGTKVEEVKALIAQLNLPSETTGVRPQFGMGAYIGKVVEGEFEIRQPAFPKASQFFGAIAAREFGVELDPDWMLKVTPPDNGGVPSFSFISPSKWEITQDQIYISPEGQRFTREELEAQLVAPEIALEAQDVFGELEEAIGRVFPTVEDTGQIINWLVESEENQIEFLELVQRIGRNEDTVALLTQLGASDEDINLILGEPPLPLERRLEQVRPPLQFPAPFPLQETPEQREANLRVYKLYRQQTEQPLSYDVWRRETALIQAQVTGELREDVIRKLAALPITAEAKRMRQEFAEQSPLIAQFIAGWGDVITTGAGALQWLGQDELAKSFRELAQPLKEDVPPPEMPELSWKSATDPYFWASLPEFLVRNTPFTLSLVPAMIVGFTGGTAIAGALGLSSLWTFILGAVGATTLSRPMEGVLEAGGAYDEALARGMSPEEADKVAQEVFLKNLTLSGWDISQIATAFLPAPARLLANPLLKVVIVGGRVVVTGLTEAGEEALQEVFNKQALGDPVVLDQNMLQAMILGFTMGAGMGAGGAAFTTIVDRTAASIPPDMQPKFNDDIDEGIQNGLTEQQAILVALDKFSQTPEGQKIITDVVQQVQKEDAEMQIEASKERQKEITPEPVPEAIETFLATPDEQILRPSSEIVDALKARGFSSDYIATKMPIREMKQALAAPIPKAVTPEVTKPQRFDIGDLVYIKGSPDRYGRVRHIAGYQHTIVDPQGNVIKRGAPDLTLIRKDVPELEPGGKPAPDIEYEKTIVAIPKPPAVEEVKPEVAEPVEVKTRRQLTGLGRMYQEWWSKLKTAEQTKASLATFVKENLPLNIRGKYISAVARVKTDAQLQTQMAKVQEVAELNAQKVLKVEIRKELKKAQAKVKEHILKGKFTPEVQRRLDVVTHNLELDRDTAREKIAQNIEAYQEGKLGYEEMLSDNEMLNFAGIDGMSAEELANTLEYIKILETIGKSERQAKQEVATERINTIRSDVSNVLTGGQGLKTGIGAIPRGELIAKTGWWDAFTNWQYGIDSLADKLSKLDPTSKPYQSELSKFVAQVHRATNRQISTTKVAFNKIKDIVGEVYGVKGTHDINQILNGLEEEVNLGVFELTDAYKANHPGATTITLKMTRNQMIAKYMQMQDPTLNDTFATGMGWSQDVRDAVTNNLSVEEKKLADGIFEFYEDYYTATNEIYQELFNVDMPHNPVYSPIRRDFEADVVENVLTMRDASQFASVLNGSLKARQRNIRPLRFNGATDILSNHIQQMEHFKAWATTMRDMRRVFGNKKIRQAIEQYHGTGVLKLVDTFLNQMARGGIETAATNRAADFLRRNFTKSILAIKPVILLKQIPSLFGYMSEMNVTEFLVGVADYWTSPIKNFNFLRNNSQMFKARIEQGFERDIRAAMQKHGKQLISGRGKLTDWFLLQIRLGDTFAITQGMWAKYKAGLKQGLTQEEAIASAEDTTGRTQPSFGIDTLSAIQNGGSWLKLMTMFQNQPNKYFRMTGDNLRNFRYGRGSRAKAASTILLAWVILPMMFQYIADAFQWKPERQARAGILGPLNFILIGGQLVQSMWGWLTDQPFDYQISPVAQTGRDLQMIFLKAKKLVEQGLDPYKDLSPSDMAALVEYLAKAAGQVTGLPTPYFVQLSKLVRHKFEAGEELQIKDFLFSEWALKPPAKTAEEQVEDINLKLGEVREGQEDLPLTEKELKIFTTVDWFREIGKVYDSVLPQDVLDDLKASVESKAWAEYEIARSKADILPDISLHKINTEDNEDTIIHYYQQWKSRERIESLPELIEFDKLYPKANLGNVTRQQYNLLVKYLESEDKDVFLESHPELKINLRNEWLKANPIDNARLALGGQAKILNLEAYNEFNKLVKELDIPDDAIPELTLPPEGSVENYFKYLEIGEDIGYNSWEVQLIIAQDDELRTFLDREPIETPVRSLELKVKHRELFDQYDTLETDEDRAKLKADNPEWVDDMRRIEAIEHDASDEIVENWAERGSLVDEFGASSSEVKAWLIDHPDTFKWALDQELLTDDGSDWNIQVLRISGQWRIQDEEYEALATTEARDAYLTSHAEYHKARRQRDAYSIENFPEAQIDTYVDWYTNPELKKPEDFEGTYYGDDWYLQEHLEFYNTMIELGIWKERDFSKVPTREVFALYQEWEALRDAEGVALRTERREFEALHPDLDQWLNLTKGTKLETETKAVTTPPSLGEGELAERIAGLKERISTLEPQKEEGLETLIANFHEAEGDEKFEILGRAVDTYGQLAVKDALPSEDVFTYTWDIRSFDWAKYGILPHYIHWGNEFHKVFAWLSLPPDTEQLKRVKARVPEFQEIVIDQLLPIYQGEPENAFPIKTWEALLKLAVDRYGAEELIELVENIGAPNQWERIKEEIRK